MTSILACEDEAHLAAFTEQDEEFYGFALELPGTLTVMAEVLLWTLGVKKLDLGTAITRVVLNEGDQPTVQSCA